MRMAVARQTLRGLIDIAAAGPPNLNNLDPLIDEVTPHIDRRKHVIDAGKGIANAQPGVNFALSAGQGPRPGGKSQEPSGFFVGGSLMGTF
jgi:hypothetical protein